MCRIFNQRAVIAGFLLIAAIYVFGEPVVFQEAVPVPGGLLALYEQRPDEDVAKWAREVLIESLSAGQGRAGAAALRLDLVAMAGDLSPAAPERTDALIPVACAEAGLTFFQDCEGSPELWRWLFASGPRMQQVAETLAGEDQPLKVARIMQTLSEHDPDGRDAWFNLIIALAVVWDTPRKEMHDQIGKGWLPPDADICRYYDYFKHLYAFSKAAVRYQELSVDSLVFVVDVPAPVRELEWALKNVKGTRTGWEKNYDKITYDLTRLVTGLYDWPHRSYSLQEIEECHGICVDQAYYCVLSARAHGIPAVYFHGKGKYGGHAWAGFLKKKNQWDFDVGRYSQQGYATGFAVHPQTDQQMTDHELELYCARILSSARCRDADMLSRLSCVLAVEKNAGAALLCARRARAIDPLCADAWTAEYDLLVEARRPDEALALLETEAVCFDDFPDEVTEIRKRQASLLTEMGDAQTAGTILRREAAWVESRRDDLQRDLVLAQADQLLAQGDAQKGLDAIGRVLWEQRDQGAKIYPLIKKYIEFAEKNDLVPESESLLKSLGR